MNTLPRIEEEKSPATGSNRTHYLSVMRCVPSRYPKTSAPKTSEKLGTV